MTWCKRMIISRAPFRISFAGGGTDFQDFYEKEHGLVVSTTINKYMYVVVHKPFDDLIALRYAKTEFVKELDEIQHPLIKESFKMLGIGRPIHVDSIADIPKAGGSGLGSSSAYVIALLNGLYAFKGEFASKGKLASQACEIEIDRLGAPIGKQDQYSIAFGGLNSIKFDTNGDISVHPIPIRKSHKDELKNNIIMFYTGMTRDANSILRHQKENTSRKDVFERLVKMRDIALDMKGALHRGDLAMFGEMLHRSWMHKKTLAAGIANDAIDRYYEKAISAGAQGGKLLGAGGGGFLLLYCDEGHRQKVREALSELRETPIDFDNEGIRTIYYGESQ